MRRVWLFALALTILLPLLAVMLVLSAVSASQAPCGRSPPCGGGPVGGVPVTDIPIFQGAARSSASAIEAHPSSLRSTTSSDVRHLYPPGCAFGRRRRRGRRANADRDERTPRATPGTGSRSRTGRSRPGSRRTSTTRPTLSTAPPTTCRHPARLVTGRARSSTTTTQAPMSSRCFPWPPAITPRACTAQGSGQLARPPAWAR